MPSRISDSGLLTEIKDIQRRLRALEYSPRAFTVTAKYRTDNGAMTAYFQSRRMFVLPF